MRYKNLFYTTPRCVTRLGEAIFLKLPLYQSKNFIEPIYINEALFLSIFPHEKKTNFKTYATFIKKLFSITINPSDSIGQCGFAYVDRQLDLNCPFALGGNAGSGRAYYIGSCFNIKGEKTPLATSYIARLSNGILSFEDALWSALIGNSLIEFTPKPSPILAILKVNDIEYKIIRIDKNGELDRITHVYANPHPIKKRQFCNIAKAFGKLEAQKFIHRILHGAWSAGNISLKAHLIDYDTMAAVKGRQPQFSFTPNYINNFFGFEKIGQLEILKSLSENNCINDSKTSLKTLETILNKQFKLSIREGLLYLMGFADYKALSSVYCEMIEPIVKVFLEYSRLTYYISRESLFTNNPSHLLFYVFDFSLLFRLYPLLHMYSKDKFSDSLSLLMHSTLQENMIFAEFNNAQSLNPLIPNMFEQLRPYLVPYQNSYYEELLIKAKVFIKSFSDLFNTLLSASKSHRNEIALRAYVINEDRFYLFPVFSLELFLKQNINKYPTYIINNFITKLVEANKRMPQTNTDGFYQTDLRLYKEGYSCIQIYNTNKVYMMVCLYNDLIKQTFNHHCLWHMLFKNTKIAASAKITQEEIIILSEAISLKDLLIQDMSRDTTFKINLCDISLYCNNEKQELTDLFYDNNDQQQYYF